MPISPNLNIGIGEIGSEIVAQLSVFFQQRESNYLPFVSFHQLSIVDGKKNLRTVSLEENDYFHDNLNSSLQSAYNRLFNISLQTDYPEVDLDQKRINLYLQVDDHELLNLSEELIREVESLIKDNIFKSLKIRVFLLLTNEIGIVENKDRELYSLYLDKLKSLQEELKSISEIIIVDDKNCNGVNLDHTIKYQSFSIKEILIILMTNEYSVLGNLSSQIGYGIISFGLSMLYFDKLYLKHFIINEIIKNKIDNEKIGQKEYDIADGVKRYNEVVRDYLIPMCNNDLSTKEFHDKTKKLEENINLFDLKILDYQFLLSNLIGEHTKINLKQPIEEDSSYSIDDLIYTVASKLKSLEPNDEEKIVDYIRVENVKQKLARIHELKNEDLDDDNQAEVDDLREIIENYNASKNDIIKQYGSKEFRKTILKQIRAVYNKKVELSDNIYFAQKKIDAFEQIYNKRSALCKFFNRKTKRNFEVRINGLQQEITRSKQEIEKLLDKSHEYLANNNYKEDLEFLDLLFKLRSEIVENLKKSNQGRSQIDLLLGKYRKELEEILCFNNSYIRNIVDFDNLKQYVNRNDDLYNQIKDLLPNIFEDTSASSNNFTNDLEKKVNQNATQLLNEIDFKMSEYVLNGYSTCEFLKHWNISQIDGLKHSSVPFINIASGSDLNTLFLSAYNDRHRKGDIVAAMDSNYPGTPPSNINIDENNKFILFSIEVINDLKNIVKYNL